MMFGFIFRFVHRLMFDDRLFGSLSSLEMCCCSMAKRREFELGCFLLLLYVGDNDQCHHHLLSYPAFLYVITSMRNDRLSYFSFLFCHTVPHTSYPINRHDMAKWKVSLSPITR